MDLKIIEEILKPYLQEHDLIFCDAELVKEFGYLILRVSLDKKGGIEIDELAKANEYLSVKIEQYDQDMPEYMLEVCSLGAERVLKTKEEITEHVGSYIHVEVPNMIYEGTLEEFVDDKISMRINAKGRFKKVVIGYEEIKLIRLAVKI